jgi:hypothetical protein
MLHNGTPYKYVLFDIFFGRLMLYGPTCKQFFEIIQKLVFHLVEWKGPTML